MENEQAPRPKKRRGFAAMDPDKRREIARKGGRAAQDAGTAHQFTPEEARAAGRKGGIAAHARGTGHRWTAEEAAAAGKKGGMRPRPPRRKQPAPPEAGR